LNDTSAKEKLAPYEEALETARANHEDRLERVRQARVALKAA